MPLQEALIAPPGALLSALIALQEPSYRPSRASPEPRTGAEPPNRERPEPSESAGDCGSAAPHSRPRVGRYLSAKARRGAAAICPRGLICAAELSRRPPISAPQSYREGRRCVSRYLPAKAISGAVRQSLSPRDGQSPSRGGYIRSWLA